MANLCLILGNGKQDIPLVKGARGRNETPAKPSQAVTESVYGARAVLLSS